MSKQLLIEALATELDTTKAQAGRTLDAVLSTIFTVAKSDGEVTLGRTFGKFVTAIRPARSGKNPTTGKPYTSPEKQVIKFKPAKYLRDQIAEG